MTDPRDLQIEGLRRLLEAERAEHNTTRINCSRWRGEAHRARETINQLESRLRQYTGEDLLEDEE